MTTSTTPYRFDEFFDSGLEETVSPFLKPRSRPWGKDLPLKASLLSAVLLIFAFALSFHPLVLPISNLCLVGCYFLAGIPKLIDALSDLLSFEINIDVLMTLAAFLSVLIGSALEGGLLLVLFAISGSIEEAVTSKAKSTLRSLQNLAPSMAYVIGEKGKIHERNTRDVAPGTHILIKAGEVAPLDGTVVEGTSSISLVHLTGESLPQRVEPGQSMPAGATNGEGVLVLKVSHTSSDSTIARIIELVTKAQESRPKFQRWLDRFSGLYAKSIILLSLIFAIALPWVFHLDYLGYEGSVYRALAFLIAASPCALIIALPIAYLSAVSSCARQGILLKGGVTLDAVASCTACAFDKTGTLTTGELTCRAIDPLLEVDRALCDQALEVAYGLERGAVHPIAKAVQTHADDQGLNPADIQDFRVRPGYGIEGMFSGQYVYIGHPEYIRDRLSVDQWHAIDQRSQEIQQQGELLSTLLLGDKIFLFRFQDTPRVGIRQTLELLKKRLRLIMLTGDHPANAKAVADLVGIDEYFADLRPEDKLTHVERLSTTQGLAMVGDGINDAPALARATAGISMGKVGSRTAIDASDVVLLHDRLDLLNWLWDKAHRTQRVVKENVGLALVAIVFASLAALFGIIPLWLAVVLHEGGTVIVGLNSLRLLRR